MCLIAFAFQHQQQFPLLLIANRDEFYARPTAALHWWNDDPHVLAGRDLQDGGTWMGIARNGRFAALTNYRAPEFMEGGKPSRGGLVQRFLASDISTEDMQRFLRTQGQQYNGFNLIYGSAEELFYYNNVADTHRQLYPGMYALSNAYLDTPWPKVRKLKSAFETQVQKPPHEESLIQLMQDTETAADSELPNTGVPPEWEKRLSAMFITSPEYGTRLTTFVSIDRSGQVIYREKGYHPASDTRITFAVEK